MALVADLIMRWYREFLRTFFLLENLVIPPEKRFILKTSVLEPQENNRK